MLHLKNVYKKAKKYNLQIFLLLKSLKYKKWIQQSKFKFWMNLIVYPSILSPAMDEELGRLGSLALVKQSFSENSEFKLALFCLKTDLVSYSACAERVG